MAKPFVLWDDVSLSLPAAVMTKLAAIFAPVGAATAASLTTEAATARAAEAKINGVAITGVPATGQVPMATSGTAATWQTPPAGGAATTDASLLTTGTLADARLPVAVNTAAVALKATVASVTAEAGTARTNEANASFLTTGTVADARLPATMAAKTFTSGANSLTMAVVVANGAAAPTGLPTGTLIVELV